MSRRIWKLLPWVVSGMLVAWAASSLDLQGAAEAFEEVRWLPYLVLTTAWACLNLLAEGAFLALTLRWVERIDRPLEVMRARAASYLLVLVNTLLGYGGMAVWMKRRLGLPIRRGAAVMLNEAFHEIGAMALLAGAFGSLTGQPAVGRAGLICFGLWVAGVLLSRVTRRLGAPRTLLSWFEEPALRHYAGWLALKVGQNLAMGAWVALTLPLFGIRPPLGAAVAITQVVHMARALPVAALGLGVDQLTLTTLFSPWEVGEGSLLAFSVVFTSAVLVSRALLGLPFVGVVTAQLRSQPGLHEDSPSAMTGGGEEAAVVRPSFVH